MGQHVACCGTKQDQQACNVEDPTGLWHSELFSESVQASVQHLGNPPAHVGDDASLIGVALIAPWQAEPCCRHMRTMGVNEHTPLGLCTIAAPSERDQFSLETKLAEFLDTEHFWMAGHDEVWQKIFRIHPSCRDWVLASKAPHGATCLIEIGLLIELVPTNPATQSSEAILSWSSEDVELNFDFRCFEIRTKLMHASKKFREVLACLTQVGLIYELKSDGKPYHFALVGFFDSQNAIGNLALKVYWFKDFMWQSMELSFSLELFLGTKAVLPDKFGL